MDDYYFKTPNYNSQSSLLVYFNRAFDGLKESLVNRARGPLVLLARTTIIALMEKISVGELRVLTEQGIYTFGKTTVEDGLRAEIRVINDAFWVRMFMLSDLGFAEAYMVGDIQVSNLDALFKMFIVNRSNLSEMSMATSSIFSAINTLMNSRFINSLSNSISNISAHYDISNEMFEAFLSKDMTYSCGYFTEQLGGLVGDLQPHNSTLSKQQDQETQDSLEEAQYAKLDLIIRKANIGPTDHVLEIGSGWGSFAIRAVLKTGCQVDSITLSVEQQAHAERRIRDLGLEKSIRIHLLDYRNLPPSFTGKFDRVVSIEMIEAVGLEYLETYFAVVERSLKPGRGIGVFQVITIPEARFERYRKEVDFIRKWIFPGGILPTVTFMADAISKGSEKRLIIDSIENIGPHYARTLREWQRRFESNFEALIVPSLISSYPDLKGHPEQIEVFRRKWTYYFSYCAAGFALRVLGDHIFTLTREGNLSLS
ncbi:Mycolic acid cyclopropane synthetase-domain-containing protein [Melampsora americana]|nr:Mycolic acid cyclopropane synthetase-domain-containing protein [Melampsora americana]